MRRLFLFAALTFSLLMPQLAVAKDKVPLTFLQARRLVNKKLLKGKKLPKHVVARRTLEGAEVAETKGRGATREKRVFFFLDTPGRGGTMLRPNQMVSVVRDQGTTTHKGTIRYAARRQGKRVQEEIALTIDKKEIGAHFAARLGRGAGTVRYERDTGRTWIDTVLPDGWQMRTTRSLPAGLDAPSALRLMQESLAASRGDPLGKIWYGL